VIKRVAYGAYEVKCPHRGCKEEFEISMRPTYCTFCGKELEKLKPQRLRQDEKAGEKP
jgi:hypothetical protein